MLKLSSGEIHAENQGRIGPETMLPGAYLATGLFEHPLPIGTISPEHELRGSHQARAPDAVTAQAPPLRQCVREGHDRLVMDLELAALHYVSQISIDLESLNRADLQASIKHDAARPAAGCPVRARSALQSRLSGRSPGLLRAMQTLALTKTSSRGGQPELAVRRRYARRLVAPLLRSRPLRAERRTRPHPAPPQCLSPVLSPADDG